MKQKLQTQLSERMRTLATRGHPQAKGLRQLADAFDSAAAGYYAEPQTVSVQKFMAAWARARRLFTEATGAPIL